MRGSEFWVTRYRAPEKTGRRPGERSTARGGRLFVVYRAAREALGCGGPCITPAGRASRRQPSRCSALHERQILTLPALPASDGSEMLWLRA
jgi:hypothetical protein